MSDELTPNDVLQDLRDLLAYGWGKLEVTVQRHIIEVVQMTPVKKKRSDTERLSRIFLTDLKSPP